MGKLLMSLILIALGFAGGVYFAYGKMESIIVTQVNQAVDQTVSLISTELESNVTDSATKFTGTSGALNTQVDAFVLQQKQNLKDKITAQTTALKVKVSSDIKTYLTNKVNVLFGVGDSSSTAQ